MKNNRTKTSRGSATQAAYDKGYRDGSTAAVSTIGNLLGRFVLGVVQGLLDPTPPKSPEPGRKDPGT